jgi:hypothetical protein
MEEYGGLYPGTRREIQPRFAGIIGDQLYGIHSVVGCVSKRSPCGHSVSWNHPRNSRQLPGKFVLDLQEFPGEGSLMPYLAPAEDGPGGGISAFEHQPSPPGAQDLPVPAAGRGDHEGETGVVHEHHVHSDAPWVLARVSALSASAC